MNRLLPGSILYIAALVHLAAQSPLDEAVDFKTVDIHGDSVQLFKVLDQENKYVLLNFYYADCEPCQHTAPFIRQAYEYFG
jgi:peroxiredoxin